MGLEIEPAQQSGIGSERCFGFIARLLPRLAVEQPEAIRRAAEDDVLAEIRPFAKWRRNQHATLVVEITAMRLTEEKMLELQNARIEAR